MALINRPNRAQRERDRSGQRHTCAACGKTGQPLALVDGYRICATHPDDPRSGYHTHHRH